MFHCFTVSESIVFKFSRKKHKNERRQVTDNFQTQNNYVCRYVCLSSNRNRTKPWISWNLWVQTCETHNNTTIMKQIWHLFVWSRAIFQKPQWLVFVCQVFVCVLLFDGVFPTVPYCFNEWIFLLFLGLLCRMRGLLSVRS